jgi:hypothetical protein
LNVLVVDPKTSWIAPRLLECGPKVPQGFESMFGWPIPVVGSNFLGEMEVVFLLPGRGPVEIATAWRHFQRKGGVQVRPFVGTAEAGTTNRSAVRTSETVSKIPRALRVPPRLANNTTLGARPIDLPN